ncbi:hypothetical protein GCM10023210_44080 [Chryseobacterium ginsengisoli]|uniref:Uncharacterized protein n=1 Tax=Chryseobacterium ginsengisoli TaxID=363853 RepID=A0ABP9MXW7_9FLAO
MEIKNIWKLFPILIIVVIIFFFEYKSSNEREAFHIAKINSHIVKKKNNWSGGRSYDYLTENNITITMMNINSLTVGDSISKLANSDNFKVYRKNRFGMYEFYKNYNIND